MIIGVVREQGQQLRVFFVASRAGFTAVRREPEPAFPT